MKTDFPIQIVYEKTLEMKALKCCCLGGSTTLRSLNSSHNVVLGNVTLSQINYTLVATHHTIGVVSDPAIKHIRCFKTGKSFM